MINDDDASKTSEPPAGALVPPIGSVNATTFVFSQVTADAPGDVKDLNDAVRHLSKLLSREGEGRAKLGKNGEPEFIQGSAAKPAFVDVEGISTKHGLWWEEGSGDKFLIERCENDQTIWSAWNYSWVQKKLRSDFVRIKAREDETLGEIDQVLLYVMEKRRLDLALEALPGYPQGIHDSNGKRILVKTSPRLVKPERGEWPTIARINEGCLNLSIASEPPGRDQAPFFHAWCKMAIESLYAGPGNFRPGQALILAGPADSGKSRLQHQIVTGLLGGRSADPGPYLFGQTDFNGEWMEAEHLLMEDPASSTAIKDRVMFGEKLKQIIVNDRKRLHSKRQTAQTLEPFFRLTISVNDDPDKLRVLPLFTPDMRDKTMLFLVAKCEMPMPTNTLQERAEFRRKIAAELPAYAWWLLNEFEIPEDQRCQRFGVKAWQHPALSQELFDDTPAAELLQLIDCATWNGSNLWQQVQIPEKHGIWEGSYQDLENLLRESSMQRETERLLKHNQIYRLLSRLKEDEPDRVSKHRTSARKLWRIAEVKK